MKNTLKLIIVMLAVVSTTYSQTTKTITTTTTTTIIEEPIPTVQAPDFVITYGNTVYNSYEYTIINMSSNIISVQPISNPNKVIILKGPSITDVYILETSPSYLTFKIHWGVFWSGYPHIHHFNRWSTYYKSPHYSNNVRQAVRQSHRQTTRQVTRQVKRKADRRQDDRQDNRSDYGSNNNHKSSKKPNNKGRMNR